jgi:hypothetical protein
LDQSAELSIENLAKDAFAATCEELPSTRAEEERQTLAEASRTGNSATYPNALVILAGQRVRDLILAGIDAYLDVFTRCEVPAVHGAESFFETSAQQIAGGADPWVRGQLDLYKTRTRRQVSEPGEYLNRQILQAKRLALRKGKLRLREQRIKAKRIAEAALAAVPRMENTTGVASPPRDRRATPSDFWEGLRLDFMQLRKECAINPPLLPAGRLTAIWTAHPAPGSWRLDYWNSKDGSGVTKRFEWHAQSAAARLGCAEEGHAALSFWLDNVGRDAPASHIRTINSSGPADVDALFSREILDICGLSADYCRKCAADEMRPRVPVRAEEQQPPETTPKKVKTPAQRLTEYKVLKKIRTQDLVAEALDLERSVYFELKAGRKVSEETYVKAALGIGCSPDDLKP